MRLTASFEYVGMCDYWGGNGRRWDADAGCVFAYYGPTTTLREVIEGAAEDYNDTGDFYPAEEGAPDLFEDITAEDVKAAILESLTDKGRRDFESGAIFEGAAEYAADGEFYCSVCERPLGESHAPSCEWERGPVELDQCENEYYESPVVIFLLELTDED